MIFIRARIKVPHSHPPLCINIINLGVLLDHTVSWIQHITYVKNKIEKGMCIMYKARGYLSQKVLLIYTIHICSPI